jgi:hypothetical protein
MSDRTVRHIEATEHPGFPCHQCAVGKHAACDGFDGRHGHPDSTPLCICRGCFPNRYRNLIDYGWSNP